MDRLTSLARRVLDGDRLGREDGLYLAALQGPGRAELMSWAGRIRRAHFGDEVRFCAIGAGRVGACAEDCKWCAQSAHHGGAVTPGRTAPDALAQAGRRAHRQGACAFGIVNSGRAPSRGDLDDVARTAELLGQDEPDLAVCASLGEIDLPAARRLAAAGVKRYHHNLETSERFYGSMVTTHAWADRVATCQAARQAGLSVCSGGLFGLGETWEDRVALALALRDRVGPDVVPLNFLHPVAGTPLADRPPLAPMECLHIIALFRLLLPTVDIKVAGGRPLCLRDLQSWIFAAGATSCLVGDYLTTQGRSPQTDRQMVEDLGLTLVTSFSRRTDATPCRTPS